MPGTTCPKCGEPKLPHKSYCPKCFNEWQNEYKKTHRQVRTLEQKARQLQTDRERIARMTPEERQAHYAKKEAGKQRWLAANPEMRDRINQKAKEKRTTWTPERLARQKEVQKAHYDRRMLRVEQGLCAYSVNCTEPAIGKQKFCLRHWIHGIRQADVRQRPQYSEEQLLDLWNKQAGKCAMSGLPLIPGDTASLDHIDPVQNGGPSTIENVRFAHAAFNRMKWVMSDQECKELILQAVVGLVEWAKTT